MSEVSISKELSDELAGLFSTGFLDDRMVSEIVQVVRKHDAARSELAALREELAKSKDLSVTNILMDVVPGADGMGQEVYAKSVSELQLLIANLYLKADEADEHLTAAEQRNAEWRKLLVRMHQADALSHNCGLWKDIDAALKPTESGASE